MITPLKIAVTGSGGQLGLAIREVAGNSPNILFTTRAELDISSKKSIESFFKEHQPRAIINTAAYTQVDAAENEIDKAFAQNAEAVRLLAEAAKQYGCKLIHVSTDYVFDGSAKVPYNEIVKTNPVTAYGKSKLAGEEYILNSGVKEFAIVRTSWLYSNQGNNFYKTMLRLAQTRDEISVVNDQTGSPTYAVHLAAALLKIAEKLKPETSGVYHYSNKGTASWYTFAKEIFKETGAKTTVHPVPSSEYPTAAKRPHYSVLETSKVSQVFNLTIPTWQEGLTECIENANNKFL